MLPKMQAQAAAEDNTVCKALHGKTTAMISRVTAAAAAAFAFAFCSDGSSQELVF